MSHLPSVRGRPAALLVVLALAAAMMLGASGPASAHATLLTSDPAQGAVLEAAPERVRFTFSEAVAAIPDGVRVFDAQGGQVASSAAVAGKKLDVTLPDELGTGTFIVVWRVISEDGHPVSGSLSFSIGAPSAEVAQPPEGGGSTEAPLVLKVLRWLGYVGLLVAVGLVAFALLVLPRDELPDGAGGGLLRGARYGAAVAAVAWLAALPVTGAYQAGGGMGAAASGSSWSTLTPTEYGVAAAVVIGVNLAVACARRPTGVQRTAALAAGLVAVCAPALTGHTRAARPEVLAVAADMLHLVVGSVWFGGLVALVVVLPRLVARGVVAAEVLARFSAIAAGLLVALVATGSLLTWRIVGSWSALVETTYGQLLLLKVGIAAIAVLLAAWNRYRLLPGLQDTRRRGELRSGVGLVVRTTMAEATALLAVLLVTGVLVDRSPEADAAAAARDVQTAMLGAFTVEARMSPLRTGSTTVTIETRDAMGEFIEGLEAPRAALSSGDVDLGALELTNIGPGTYTGKAVLPSPGIWRLQVSLRVTEFDNPVTVLEFDVPDE